RSRLASQLHRWDGHCESERVQLTNVLAWRHLFDTKRGFDDVGDSRSRQRNDPSLDVRADTYNEHDDNYYDDNDDNDDTVHHNDKLEPDCSPGLDVLCVGEPALLVLRLDGSELRSERHVHDPADVHRGGGLQQLRLRRSARGCRQVV